MSEQLNQGTDSWKLWRGKGIGSSDAASIMGVSPYRTALDVWKEKTGQGPAQESHWAMERGTELEPKARAHYELTTDIDMEPCLFEHPEYPFLRASLDGYNPAQKRVLEIKCPGKVDHATALAGMVPDHYLPQVHHLMMVSGAESAHYYSFDGEKGVLVEVLKDPEYEAKLMQAEIAFWKLVETKTPPALSDKDYMTIEDAEQVALFEEWKAAKIAETQAGERVDALKKKIVSVVPHTRARCAGVIFYKSYRAGAIDYAKVPEIKGVDLEKYRKRDSEVITLKLENEKE